ncbi:T-complex protein 1 subunit delta [Nymphaea thermarum]|nr:T-complex protein 1 subunit delta [Nymphaea thermarum]
MTSSLFAASSLITRPACQPCTWWSDQYGEHENHRYPVPDFTTKTDIEQSIVVSDYTQVDRIFKEESNYILVLTKKIKATGCMQRPHLPHAGSATGCMVLPIQKSILPYAVTDLSLHFLAKAKILVVKDAKRDENEFLTKTLNCLPITNIKHFREEKLALADWWRKFPLGKGR